MPNPARDSSGASVPDGSSGSGVLAASQGTVSGAQTGGNGQGRLGIQPARTATGVETPPPDAFGRGDFEVGQVWTAALELTIATHGAEPYNSRLRELFPQMITPQRMDRQGWTAVRALPYLEASAKDQLREAVKTHMATEDKQLDSTPFGVPPSLRTWGGSGAVVSRVA